MLTYCKVKELIYPGVGSDSARGQRGAAPDCVGHLEGARKVSLLPNKNPNLIEPYNTVILTLLC